MRNPKSIFVLFAFLSAILFITPGCLQKPKHKPLKIALSKAGPGEHYQNYKNWMHIVDSTIVYYDMYNMPFDSALDLIEHCDGLVLTGGADIYPDWYGKIEDTAKCGTFDMKRDTLEMNLIKKAMSHKIPILGICRGLQVMNVYLGGTLVVDIPTDYDTSIKHRIIEDPLRCYHKVSIDKNSKLYKTSRASMGFVTSNHHQGIEILGDELKIVAHAEDNLPEAIEWLDPKAKPFFLAVQWHPERMDKSNPLSLPLALYFLKAIEEKQMQLETK